TVDEEISRIERELRGLGAEHRYVPLLMTIPGVAWILGYTIAAEIGEIDRFRGPKQLVGYTGLCPKVIQSGGQDRRGPLAKNGPKYLRWGYIEAATHACCHEPYRPLYQRTKQRLGRNRGAKIATITVARKLAEASWWMLSKGEPFAPAGATQVLAA
ncbi:MAG TPA: transposase, partial [Gaiellaceae bacterium]|nr:transposase [Gaiellaceae bacterium]